MFNEDLRKSSGSTLLNSRPRLFLKPDPLPAADQIKHQGNEGNQVKPNGGGKGFGEEFKGTKCCTQQHNQQPRNFQHPEHLFRYFLMVSIPVTFLILYLLKSWLASKPCPKMTSSAVVIFTC